MTPRLMLRSRTDARRPAEMVMDEENDEGQCLDPSRFDVDEDTADAHRQVLEMSNTIAILTRDFESLQRELLDAYKKLQEVSEQNARLQLNRSLSPTKVGTTIHGGIVSNAMAKLRAGNYAGDDCGCDHERHVQEFQQIVAVKDTALTEALQERNEYKLRMERAEGMLRDLTGGDARSNSGRGLQVQTSSSRTASFTSAGIPYGMTSTSPVHYTPSMSTSGSVSSAATARELPKHERFDQESSYQSKEDDELFWRRQYRDAVRMRKHQGQPIAAVSNVGAVSSSGNAKPSLKIFSYPNVNRQKGITDENVPFTRYIGISTRQNEIIKEQHRLLS